MNQAEIINIGLIVIFIGIIIIISSMFFGQEKSVKFSFFGLIGPIPFGFANDKRLFIISLVVFVAVIILFLLMFYNKFRITY